MHLQGQHSLSLFGIAVKKEFQSIQTDMLPGIVIRSCQAFSSGLPVILLSHGRLSESSGGAAGSPNTRPAAGPELSLHVLLQCHSKEIIRLDLTPDLL